MEKRDEDHDDGIVDIRKWRTMLPLGDIDEHLLEIACAAYHDHGLDTGVYNWNQLVAREDRRIPAWREKMQAALTAIHLDEKYSWEITEVELGDTIIKL